jgi:hypothetical protein
MPATPGGESDDAARGDGGRTSDQGPESETDRELQTAGVGTSTEKESVATGRPWPPGLATSAATSRPSDAATGFGAGPERPARSARTCGGGGGRH